MNDVAAQNEVTLWQAVIQQAMADATLGVFVEGRGRRRTATPSSCRLSHLRSARDWLLGMSKDFRTVCEWALLEPLAVKAAAEKSIAAFEQAHPQFTSPAGHRVAPIKATDTARCDASKALDPLQHFLA
jgi:hypothetical protein